MILFLTIIKIVAVIVNRKKNKINPVYLKLLSNHSNLHVMRSSSYYKDIKKDKDRVIEVEVVGKRLSHFSTTNSLKLTRILHTKLCYKVTNKTVQVNQTVIFLSNLNEFNDLGC